MQFEPAYVVQQWLELLIESENKAPKDADEFGVFSGTEPGPTNSARLRLTIIPISDLNSLSTADLRSGSREPVRERLQIRLAGSSDADIEEGNALMSWLSREVIDGSNVGEPFEMLSETDPDADPVWIKVEHPHRIGGVAFGFDERAGIPRWSVEFTGIISETTEPTTQG